MASNSSTDHGGGKRRAGICGKWGIVKRRSSLFQIRDARHQRGMAPDRRFGGWGCVRGHCRDQRDHIAGRPINRTNHRPEYSRPYVASRVRANSGSFAMFAAIRRASSRVSNNDDGKIPLSSAYLQRRPACVCCCRLWPHALAPPRGLALDQGV
jgi:hypothetical protein